MSTVANDPQSPLVQSEPGSVLQKAAKRFALHNPIEATDALWRAYSSNRRAAWSIRKRDRKAEAEGYESPESDDDWAYMYPRDDTIHVFRSIRRTLRALEGEMGLPGGLLQKSVAVLSCEAGFEEAWDPRTVSTISRIYSPSRPAYIDVHLLYHHRMRSSWLEWHYSIGYKIYTRPQGRGPAKELPADLDINKLKECFGGGLGNMHVNKGWRSIAWATWDDLGRGNSGQRRVEERSCDLYDEGILDLHEALFGALPEPVDDGESDGARRKAAVNVARLLLGVVGIDYEIAYEEGEEDVPPGMDQRDEKQGHVEWMLFGMSDQWMAREVRRACGFQLARDPIEEEAGKKDRKEEKNRPKEYWEEEEDEPPSCQPQ